MTASRKELLSGFFNHVAQTSLEPVGLSVGRAHGCTLLDAEGRDHIDLLAGIGVLALGHRHPRVVEAIEEQLSHYLHVMVYGEFIQEPQVRLAQALADLLPEPLDNVYFTNSGTEAVEGALKLARKATGRQRLLSFRGGFHGDTLGAMSVGGNPFYRDPYLPLLADVDFLDFNDTASLEAIDDRTAAVIVEPVQAEAGVILPQAGFLEQLRKACSDAGALLIFDEVITGLGRTGAMFATNRYGVVPDILVLAKALGGGLPLGAFVASRMTMRSLAVDPPLGHVTTFGGNPLSCAAGLATMEVIEEQGLAGRAEHVGAVLESGLQQRLGGCGVAQVRRAGLLIGVELESAEVLSKLVRECRRERLILGWTLHDDRVLRLAPPLVISDVEIDEALARFERAAWRLEHAHKNN